MMKGLLYKEFYLTRKTYLGFVGLALGFSMLGVMVCLSMLCGNLQRLAAEDPDSVKMFASVFTYTPFLLALCQVSACSQSICADYTTGWMKYSYTLPVSAVRMTVARYLTGAILLGACAFYGVGNAVIISGITKLPIKGELVKNMMVLWFIACIVCLVRIPMAFQYKTTQAIGNRLGLLLIVAYVAAGGYFFQKTSQMSIEESDQFIEEMTIKLAELRDRLLPILPLIIILLFGISFFLSVKIYQRREK